MDANRSDQKRLKADLKIRNCMTSNTLSDQNLLLDVSMNKKASRLSLEKPIRSDVLALAIFGHASVLSVKQVISFQIKSTNLLNTRRFGSVCDIAIDQHR